MSDLAADWARAAAGVGASGDVAGVGANLLARYAEPHRRYHDVHHLETVLRHVDELAPCAASPAVVRVAAWFHDAVYDPNRRDNEERSAKLAEDLLAQLRVDPRVIAEVARLVRATSTHAAQPGDGNAAALCDADLAILASDRRPYAAYVEGVRGEYAHLSDDAFARGRAAVLRGLLARGALYATARGRDWEAAARRNLTAELATYQPSAPR